MVLSSSRLFLLQFLAILCGGAPVEVGGLWAEAPFCLSAVVYLSLLWMVDSLRQPFVSRGSVLLLGLLWVGLGWVHGIRLPGCMVMQLHAYVLVSSQVHGSGVAGVWWQGVWQ